MAGPLDAGRDMVTLETARRALERVEDPELPGVTVTDLGIVRRLTVEDDTARVEITPTYSGCPAMTTIRRDILRHLRAAGFREVEVTTNLETPWTTDWITESGRRRLAELSIAPPGVDCRCPNCGSAGVAVVSEFGSTACKSLMSCGSCREPFHRFKEL